jgi:hypothetical protein
MADHNLFTHKAFRQTAQSHALWATGVEVRNLCVGLGGGGGGAAAVTVFSSQTRRVAFRASLPAPSRVRTFARAVRSAVRVSARYGRRLKLDL